MTDDSIDLVLKAGSARELFSGGDAEAIFNRLKREVHPDLNPARSEDATAAFIKLSELYKRFGASKNLTFVTKKGSWTLGGDIWKSSGVRYRSVQGTEETWVAYVATAKATGPFVEGHRNLEQISKGVMEEDLKNTTTHSYFLPRIVDKFKLGDQQREARALSANVPGTRWFPLSSFTSIDPRDIGWISRRALMALAIVHRQGYLHGSPHLEAFIVEPAQHGLMLKDWQYSLRMGDPISTVDPQALDAYPTWVKDLGATKDGKLDVIVFAHAFLKLSKTSGAPLWLQEFFADILQSPPNSAAMVLDELTALLDKHWERKFHVMEYPY